MNKIKCKYCEKTYSKQMRLCPFCGEENIPETGHKIPVCPACKCELENYSYRDNDLDICPECHGLWLDSCEFKRLTSIRDVYKDDSIPYKFSKKPLENKKGYLPCPICGELMPRRNFRRISGVLIDICRDHGIWLDPGELEQIRCFIANGGTEKYLEKEIITNKLKLQSLATRVSDVEFMQKLLHHWNLKRWMFSK
ncbi:MAG: hypothetical protein GH151_07235 [Bacteroidetes bacterium]|nr:hypothetical protein [Bacteroidota bacterium]